LKTAKIALLALLSAGILLTSCSDEDGSPANLPSPETLSLDIGVVQSLTGAGSIYGASVVKGIDLAIKEMNEGAVSPVLRVSQEVRDDASNPEMGRAAFQTFVDRKVDAIIGPTLSTVALDAVEPAQDGRVPVLGATLTAAGITEQGDYVFRIALTEAVVVPATLEAVSKKVPLHNVVLILNSAEAFSRSSADAMRKGMAAIGASLVAEIDTSKESDLHVALAALDGDAIDAFLVTPLVEESASILRTIREQGFGQTVVGGNGFNTPDIARLAGSAIEGAYAGAAWNPTDPSASSKRFVEAYTKEYREVPDLFAAQGYTAVQVLADAVRRAGSTAATSVRAALAETKAVDTPLGRLSMSPERNAVHAPVVQQFRDGKLRVVQ
jgi:branched-chain amino acid transport system substrate-binding protein